MANKILLLSLYSVFLNSDFTAAVVGPPSYNGSFRAIGEIVMVSEDGSGKDVVYFEENYDRHVDRASLRIIAGPLEIKYYEFLGINKTFSLLDKDCSLASKSDFSDIGELNILSDLNGNPLFFVRELLSLPPGKAVLLENQMTNVRGHKSQAWKYTFDKVNATVIWSDPDEVGMSSYGPVPLAIDTETQNANDSNFISIFYFIHDTYNETDLEIPDGVYCPDLEFPERLPFPDVSSWKTLAYKVEMTDSTLDRTLESDVWIDSQNGLYQINYDPKDGTPDIGDGPSEYPHLNAVLLEEDEAAFIITTNGPNPGCKVRNITELKYDPQMTFDRRSISMMKVEQFFGINSTKYKFVKSTEKRDIPCSMWQGVRNDWPSKEMNVTTLWEWCFAGPEDAPERLATLEVTVTDVQSDVSAWFYPPNSKLSYSFYDFDHSLSPKVMNLQSFDITSCFSLTHYKDYQITLDVPGEVLAQVEPIAASLEFIARWQSSIISAAGAEPAALRVRNTKTITAHPVILVQFRLLERHPDLPRQEREKEISLQKMLSNIEAKVNNGSLGISTENITHDVITVMARPGSLQLLPIEIKTTTAQPTTSPHGQSTASTGQPTTPQGQSTTSQGQSTTSQGQSTTSQGQSTTSQGQPTGSGASREQTDFTMETTIVTTDKYLDIIEDNGTRYSPGSMAGMAIGMLITGFGVGAGGIFAKHRFLPQYRIGNI